MTSDYSTAGVLDFLNYASERGLVPVATSQALAVAVRSVLDVLDQNEQEDLSRLDLDATIRRFSAQRGDDFSPTSLKEYGRRVRRALELYTQWRENPANFTARTRETAVSRKYRTSPGAEASSAVGTAGGVASVLMDAGHVSRSSAGGYQSGFPVRPGRVITLLNVPEDLTASEAERLAQFVRMLAVE